MRCLLWGQMTTLVQSLWTSGRWHPRASTQTLYSETAETTGPSFPLWEGCGGMGTLSMSGKLDAKVCESIFPSIAIFNLHNDLLSVAEFALLYR